ncbi:MAG: DUF11 domain-containing protein, partial [Lewinella sp.]|nr:DUF11 domain-containing protein [Lewinella sp.]
MQTNTTQTIEEHHLLKRPFFWLVTLALLLAAPALRAEGVAQVAPHPTDKVMLLIGQTDYGQFAQYNGPETSRLYIRLADGTESVYLGLSRAYTPDGAPLGVGDYTFRIRRASDGAVVHGPFNVNNQSENLSNWATAVAGPAALNGGDGYDTSDPRFHFQPGEGGLYYIEFLGAARIGYWDFTVARDGVEVPGRVYSKNWAFRTPADENNPPDCVWSKEFNGVLYSYTADGFVSRIDFADSGFKGLSFTVAFNRRGPGLSGDPALDRMSAPNANLSAMAAEHLIFLQEPDPVLFPDGECGSVTVAPYFECTGDNQYCLEVTTSHPGQVEILLDFNHNGQYDENLDRRLVHAFAPGDVLTTCLPWDGTLGNGEYPGAGATVDLMVQYTQGVQHWALYDAEKLQNGFCVELVRPICNPGVSTDALYWDDRLIPEDPGTGAPKDGRAGCGCIESDCRTWTNFSPNSPDCSVIDDEITTGYGDKSTLNTWWFANSSFSTLVNVPLVDLAIEGETLVCPGATTDWSLAWFSNSAIAEITWTSPDGSVLASGSSATTVSVSEPGWYEVAIVDENGCDFTAAQLLAYDDCPVDLELDITADELMPSQGQPVHFAISLTNNGPGPATGVVVNSLLPSGLTAATNLSNGGQVLGSELSWNGLSVGVGEVITFTFDATVTPAFDYTVLADVSQCSQIDTDSTPDNGVDTNNNGQCADDEGDEDDGDCLRLLPPACQLQVEINTIDCSPNGTLIDSNDDTFTASLTITGSQGAQGWVANDAAATTGQYGVTVEFGPYPIAAGDVSLTFADAFFGGECAMEVVIPAPAACSNLCQIEAEITDLSCDDNNTPALPDDDTFTFDLFVSGWNHGAGWTTDLGQSGAYDTWVTLGPFAIADGAFDLIITDAEEGGCVETVTITPPLSCSTECEILSTTVSNVDCNDQGTPTDPTDDTYTFTIVVTGNNVAGHWVASDGTAGLYGEPTLFGPYPVSSNDVFMQFRDAADPSCVSAAVIQAPEHCSTQCLIEATAANLTCLDNDTPFDPTDDAFAFDMIVEALNQPGPVWTTGGGQAGFYGQTYPMGPFPVSGGTITLSVTDILDPSCLSVLSVSAPEACSQSCQIEATLLDVYCVDAETTMQTEDDGYTYDLMVEGVNVSGGWTASDGTTGSFGAMTSSVLHGFSFDTETITIAADDGPCSTTIEVTPPMGGVLCPADTDQQLVSGNIQRIYGELSHEDESMGGQPCWMTTLDVTPWTSGNRYYDAIVFQTPAGNGDPATSTQAVNYTFYLFSNLHLPADFPGTDLAKDGSGALFNRDMTAEAQPCSFIMDFSGAAPHYTSELALVDPTFNTADIVSEGMQLVQRFSQSLREGEIYTLMTSAYLPENTGEYVWVIVSTNDNPLELLDPAVQTDFQTELELAFDLTYLDIDWVLNNPGSFPGLGLPRLEPACGIDSIGFHDELLFEDNCEDALLTRTFTAYASGGVAVDSCAQEITFRRPTYGDIVLPPSTAQFNCGDDWLATPLGYPSPVESGYPILSSGFNDSTLIDGQHFNFLVSYKDEPTEDTTTVFTDVTREWTIIDVCTDDTIIVYTQLLQIGNFDPPMLVCPLSNHYCPILEEDIMLFGVDWLACTATIEAPWPGLAGDCTSEEPWEITTEVLQVVGADTLILDSIAFDEERIVSGLAIGDYFFRYTAYDEAGDSLGLLCRFRVADLQEPTAICNNGMSVSLNGQGLYRVYPWQLDQGSYDNCGNVTLEVRRAYYRDPLTCDTLLTTAYSDWGPYAQFNCCDAGLAIPVELRVTDEHGLQNICWLYVQVNDNTLPYCTGLTDLNLSCADIPVDFDPLDTLQLQALFGYPTVVDNCAAYATELMPLVDWNTCQTGTIVRRFRARDRFGNLSVGIFEQYIHITYDNTYGIRFPQDVDSECLEAIDGLRLLTPGCAELTVTYEDQFLPPTGEECYYLERTYHVINACTYDGVSPPVVIRRDEDCDGAEGEEAVWVLVAGADAWVDRDSLPGNGLPEAGTKGTDCDGTTNVEGYWRGVNSNGYWTYTQLIRIFDEVPPVLVYDEPDPFCTIDAACEGPVNIPFSLLEFCLPDMVTVTVELDAGADGIIDADLTNSGVLTGTYPDYALEGVFPIGNHAFVLTIADGCGNALTASIPFSVVDCYVPEPIGYSGLIVDLVALPAGTDADGDGDVDEGAVTVFAADLASCEQFDCSAPLYFSVNRIGEQPDPSRDRIVLTCDDRYHLELEVYVWDQAGNPYAVQPDGVSGGPNYRSTVVEVYVQDPDQVCNYCSDNDLFIEGIIHTTTGAPLAGVEVSLHKNGTLEDQLITGEDGGYHFAGLEPGADYQVTARKTDDGVGNGISAMDLVILRDHLRDRAPITDPYLLLAADVNGSGTLTSLDVILIQGVIIGNFTSFPDNESWRFMPADYAYVTFSQEFPELLDFPNMQACQTGQDMVGIKIGDLDQSAATGENPENRPGVARNDWPVYWPDLELRAGQLYRIPVRLADVQKVAGLQMAYWFDPAQLRVEAVEPGLLSIQDMNTNRLSAGRLTTAWVQGQAVPEQDVLFTLVVTAVSNGQLADAVILEESSLVPM